MEAADDARFYERSEIRNTNSTLTSDAENRAERECGVLLKSEFVLYLFD